MPATEPVTPASGSQGPGEGGPDEAIPWRDVLEAELAAMRRLHELSTRLLSAGGLPPLLEEVLEAAMELQGADFGHVQLLNRQTGALEIVAQRGFGQAFLAEVAAVRERKAPCTRALERRARVLLQDVEADPEYAPYRPVADVAGFRAVQATPLFDRAGQPLGVLSTHFRKPHRPSERELRLTDLYARQAAEAIGLRQAEQALRASEAALRASEERLRFAAQAAGFGWFDHDLIRGQTYYSPELKALFGVSPEEDFSLDADHLPLSIHPDDRALVRKAVQEAHEPQDTGVKDLEHRIVWPDGTVRWLLVRGRTFFEGEGQACRAARASGIALDVTERKRLEQEILEISGREQRRIGHDLHDDLCQRLGGLQLLTGVLENELAAAGHPLAPQAGRIQSLVREALERARLLARGLAPVAVEAGGLASALQDLADDAAQLFRLRCEFRGDPVGLADAGAATHLYRIAQEAITNAVKHGRAKRVVISLTDAGDCFELKVIDDGNGFARTTATMAGMGLRIMKYRAAMVGATLDVQSAPGQGTTVTCAFGKRLCSAPVPAKPQ